MVWRVKGRAGYVTGSLVSLRSVTMTVTWTDSLWSLPPPTAGGGSPPPQIMSSAPLIPAIPPPFYVLTTPALRINKRLLEGKSIKQPPIYKWRGDISCDNRVVTFLFRSVIRRARARADGKARVTHGHSSSAVTFTCPLPGVEFFQFYYILNVFRPSPILFWSWVDT